MIRLTAAILLAVATPVFASSPMEGTGAAPRPTPGTGAGAAIATGMVVAGTNGAIDMPYQLFEATVHHADLSDCPQKLRQEGRFCRLGIAGEDVAVFVFSEDGDQPLLAVHTWAADGVAAGLN